jgi:hypothetical protein
MNSPRQRSRAHLLVLALLLLLCCGETLTAEPTEFTVKGAYLYNCARYVHWPESALGARSAAVVIAILGKDPFGSELDQHLRGRLAQGRPVVIRRVATVTAAADAHLLFICASERVRLPAILQALRGQACLTVSDIPGFARAGGTIELVLEEQRVRLRINRASERAAALEISSRLLQIAEIIHE